MRNIGKQLHSTCVGCIQWRGQGWSGYEILHTRSPRICGLSHSFTRHSFYMSQQAQPFAFDVSYYIFITNCVFQFLVNCFTLAMTNKLVVIINSHKVPKIKKILLYEMKFLVRNYSCLQKPWLEGYSPQIPVLCPQLNLLNSPPPSNNIPGYATDEYKTKLRITSGQGTRSTPDVATRTVLKLPTSNCEPTGTSGLSNLITCTR